MSFETVFERWLQKQGGPGDGSSEGREERQQQADAGRGDTDGSSEGREERRRQADAGRGDTDGSSEGREERRRRADAGRGDTDNRMEEEMPVIQREAWREEDMEGMPVLQKMVDLPQERKLGSPPPPPLQITLSLSESYSKQRKSKGSKTKSSDKVKGKDSGTAVGEGKRQESYALQQDVSELSEKSVVSKVKVKGEHTESSLERIRRKDSQDPSLKEKAVHQCQAKSALSELTRLNHLTSPITARGSEVDVVRSPECDLPMEPDSTSEFLLGSGRWLRARKGSEASRGEGSPWGEVSPCSAACVGLRTPTGSNSEVLVRIEESPAECDSTSMFMNSPNAISPASQGEIEERVCPVLADHEDGASPSHFMCRCHSLPPPSDLMHGAHAPVVSAASQTAVSVTDTITCQNKSKSWTHLVTRMHSLDDDPAPDLEKVAPSLDLMATPEDGSQSDHESPPVLTLPEQEARVKQFSVEHSHVKDLSAEMNQQEAPPLIRYGPEPPQVSHSDSPPVLSSNDFDSQEKGGESPPVLSLHGQEASSKPSKSKRRVVEICDFTRDIDWESAVVETVENPPSLTKYDGEGKPGIILKIRTKGKSATPSVQLISKPESVPKPLIIKRKRQTIDSAEILSRLRKRYKSEETDKSSTTENEVQTLSVGRKGTDMQHKTDAGNFQASLCHTRPKVKKSRHSTVHLGDMKVATQDFSLKDSIFALSSVELFRLQTLTYELVCILFPRLQPHLIDIAPESRAFLTIIDDIILSLERSTSEEILRDCEDLSKKFMKLSLKRSESVPVFSPQVVLCSSPGHIVEDFRGKLCCLFQLLLPDLTVSLTQTLSHSSEKLEMFLKKMIVANKAKVAGKARPCL